MDVGLIAGSRQMQTLEAWQSTIAGNLANASTPGFQKTLYSVSGTERGVQSTGSVRQANRSELVLPSGQVSHSFANGAIRVTQNPNDFAIEGGGFFGLTTSSGDRIYTKDGEFHVNEEGTLVNKLGYVVDVEGGELNVDAQQGPITVTRDGSVNQKGQSLGRISAFSFSSPNELIRLSGSYFSDSGTAGATMVEDAVVLQGHLMGSSIVPMDEMVSMIRVSRAYELSQKLIQESDERLKQAIETFSV
jgi:flagellar basal body rod protein FlgG